MTTGAGGGRASPAGPAATSSSTSPGARTWSGARSPSASIMPVRTPCADGTSPDSRCGDALTAGRGHHYRGPTPEGDRADREPDEGCTERRLTGRVVEEEKTAMDYTRLDRVRRSATPLELDVVEAYANGRMTRRQFIQRATVIGLSLPATQRSSSPAAVPGRQGWRQRRQPRGITSAPPRARRAGRRHDPLRHPAPRLGRPGGDAGPRRLRDRRPVDGIPVHAEHDRPVRSARGLPRSGPPTTTARSGHSSSGRRQVARRRSLHLG